MYRSSSKIHISMYPQLASYGTHNFIYIVSLYSQLHIYHLIVLTTSYLSSHRTYNFIYIISSYSQLHIYHLIVLTTSYILSHRTHNFLYIISSYSELHNLATSLPVTALCRGSFRERYRNILLCQEIGLLGTHFEIYF